jgi:8-oxo-dGTP diphosphatase
MRPAVLNELASAWRTRRVGRTHVVRVSAGIFLRGDHVLLAQRSAGGAAPSKWQFPGGKAKELESNEEALSRELTEELGVNISKFRLVQHAWIRDPRFAGTRVSFYLINAYEGTISPAEHQHLRWVPITQLSRFDLMDPNKAVVKHLLRMNRYARRFIWDDVWQSDTAHYGSSNIRDRRVRQKLDAIQRLGFTAARGDTILDVGCGTASASKLIKQMFPDADDVYTVVGVDRSTVAIERFVKNIDPKPLILCADATALPIRSESINKVLAFSIIEHIQDGTAFLNEMSRVLVADGEIFLCQSNSLSVVAIDRHIRRIFGIWKYGYQRNLSPYGLRKLLGGYFEIDVIEVCPPNDDVPVLRAIDRAVNRVWSQWGRNIFVRARKV